MILYYSTIGKIAKKDGYNSHKKMQQKQIKVWNNVCLYMKVLLHFLFLNKHNKLELLFLMNFQKKYARMTELQYRAQ